MSDEEKNVHDKDEFKSKLPNVSKTSDELYNFGERRCNVIHAQLRMQCSNLKAHLLALHVVDDPTCACNTGAEDNYHFFFQCPLYYAYRLELINTVNALSRFELIFYCMVTIN